jgi:hypothetical protein
MPRFCQSSEPCSNSLIYLLLFKRWCGRSRGVGGGVGEDLSLTMYFFTVGPTQIYTPQPFSLHCNKKFIHAAGDHHGSRQNIRSVRTAPYLYILSSINMALILPATLPTKFSKNGLSLHRYKRVTNIRHRKRSF